MGNSDFQNNPPCFSGLRGHWPSTSYMKAIDIWTSGCYLVVFAALAEYCTILYWTKSSAWQQQKNIEDVEKNEGSKKVRSQFLLFSLRLLRMLEAKFPPQGILGTNNEITRNSSALQEIGICDREGSEDLGSLGLFAIQHRLLVSLSLLIRTKFFLRSLMNNLRIS